MAGLSDRRKVSQILKAHFHRKKKDVSGYSMRALAKETGVSLAFTCDILNGKKSLPVERLESWSRVLCIDFHDQAKIYGLLVGKPPSGEKPKKSNYHLTTTDKFSLLKNWYYLPMVNLTTCKDFDGDFASRLGISPTIADIALRELLRHGLLEEKEGGYRKTKTKQRWSSLNPSIEIRQYHAQMMTKAKNHLLERTTQEDLDGRLISGITLAGSKAKIKEARERLSQAIHETAEFLADGEDADEIFQLSIQLFPLSQK